MKGTIKIMLAENQFSQQMMGIEIDVDDVDKKGTFTILDHLMDALKVTPAEAREFALRKLFGNFQHETISDNHVEIDSAEHRAYKRMMEGLLDDHQ